MGNVKKTNEKKEDGKRLDDSRVSRYNAIQELKAAGYSSRKIALMLDCSRNTVKKYYDADIEVVCQKIYRGSILDPYYDDIVKSLQSGMNLMDTFNHIVSLGYSGSRSGASTYMNQVAEQLQIEVQKYRSASSEIIQKRKDAQTHDYMKRSRIFKFLWMGEQLEDHQKEYLLTTFPVLAELYVAIQEFRQIFDERSLPFLHLFVDKFKQSELNPIASFANGLENDIEAIENAVTSPFSNGFVEGTISKLKMKKRVMYGRAKTNLLASKMMYEPKV